MIISQIFLSDIKEELPSFIKNCISTIKSAHPFDEYRLYDNESLVEFIKNNYEPDVLYAYNKLKPYTYKADLGKFCLMYKLGGWYYDIAVTAISQLEIPDNISCISYSIEEEMQCLTPQAIQATLFYSKPNNPIFRYAIDIIINNCKTEYYGPTPFCPTGPNVLGRAFAKYYTKYGVDSSFMFGKLRKLTNDCINKNAAFVLPDGTIHALIKPSGKTLKDFGTKGTNSYSEMYFNRDIYNHE